MRSPVILVAMAFLASAASADAQSLDHFTCYKARASAGTSQFNPVAGIGVADRYRTSTIDVRRPLTLCAPTSKNGENPSAPGHADHLVDYRIHPTTRFVPAGVETLGGQFCRHPLCLKKAR